jgi:Bromodomain associated
VSTAGAKAKKQKANNPKKSTIIIISMPRRTDDAAYCEWVARRAVARAALHLGIEDMTEEALHVLASCLLDYLGRIGSLTAAHAEASGRSTSHCNVLDAIRAVELCTSPSAINAGTSSMESGEEQQDSSMIQEDNGTGDFTTATGDVMNGENGTNHARSKYPVNSWKSLAQFCFGVDWDQHAKVGAASGGTAAGRGMGSKGAVVEDTVVSTIRKKGGWSAPFPEEIPMFPTRSIRLEETLPMHISSPATALPASGTVSDRSPDLDDDGDQNMATVGTPENSADQEMKLWGILLGASSATTPATATAKDTSKGTGDSSKQKKRQHHQVTADPFLPQFYPPIPSSSTKKIAKVKAHHYVDAASAAASTRKKWAPENDDDDDDDDDDDAAVSADQNAQVLLSVRAALVVPPGRPAKAPEPKAVVPLALASSAPVSRILEGSMDPSQP